MSDPRPDCFCCRRAIDNHITYVGDGLFEGPWCFDCAKMLSVGIEPPAREFLSWLRRPNAFTLKQWRLRILEDFGHVKMIMG